MDDRGMHFERRDEEGVDDVTVRRRFEKSTLPIKLDYRKGLF